MLVGWLESGGEVGLLLVGGRRVVPLWRSGGRVWIRPFLGVEGSWNSFRLCFSGEAWYFSVCFYQFQRS